MLLQIIKPSYFIRFQISDTHKLFLMRLQVSSHVWFKKVDFSLENVFIYNTCASMCNIVRALYFIKK